MTPMEEFTDEHGPELRDFVDSITTILPSHGAAVVIHQGTGRPLSASIPVADEAPALPYLIDQPRAFAALVTMWLHYFSPSIQISKETREFHDVCRAIERRIITEAVLKVERAERPGTSVSAERKWEEAAERALAAPPTRDVSMYARNNDSRAGGASNALVRYEQAVGNLGYSVAITSGPPKARGLGGILGFGGGRKSKATKAVDINSGGIRITEEKGVSSL